MCLNHQCSENCKLRPYEIPYKASQQSEVKEQITLLVTSTKLMQNNQLSSFSNSQKLENYFLYTL